MPQLQSILLYLRTLAGPPDLTHLSDRQLLLRYAQGHDELAFATLVSRHAPLVMGVCCRILTCAQDAEEVFQATFLVLARKAQSLRWRDSVANWLFEVAHRLALKSRTEMARRQLHERQAAKMMRMQNTRDGSLQELSGVLDEELRSLPKRYRLPLLLCYLEGRTRDQAARQMGWSLRTLHRRLERGLALLRARLTARDLTLSSVLVSVGLAQQTVSAHLSSTLLRDTVHASLAFSLRANAVQLPAVALAEEGLKSMVFAKGNMMLALLLAVGVIAIGAGVLTQRQVDTMRADENVVVGTPEPLPPQPSKGATEPSTAPRADTGALPAGARARLGTSWLRGGRWWRFLPDGKRLVQQRSDGEALIVAAVPSGRPLALIRGSDVPGRKEVIGSTMAFTRDAKYLAAVCWEGRCGIWETATGRLVRWLESGPFYSIVQCDFSPDGKFLAVGAGARQGRIEGITVGVYEVASGKKLFTTLGTNSAFAPGGRSLVTWDGYNANGGRQLVRRVEVPSGRELTSFSAQVDTPDFEPCSDGVWFFEVQDPNTIRVWDVSSAKLKHTFPGPSRGDSKVFYVRHCAGRRELIAVRTQPAEVVCWDLHSGKQLWQHRLAAPAYFPPLSADGSTLVTAESSGTVRVWDVVTGNERASFRPGIIGHTTSLVQVSPDGKRIATHSGGSFSSAVAIWDATTGKLLSDLPGHSAGITAVAYAPDGTRIYTIGKDRTLRTWDAATGRELSRISTEPATSLAVSPDGKTLFAGSVESGSVRVLDAQTGRLPRQLPVFTKSTIGLFLTADGKRLIAGGSDDEALENLSVRICDAVTGAKQRELDRFDRSLEQLAITPDGGTIATAHAGQHVLLWDAQGKKIAEQVGHGKRKPAWEKKQPTYRIGSLALSANGRWLAYSDQEQGIVLVDALSGREIGQAKVDVYYQAPAARYEVRDVLTFAPDGKTIAFSGVESTVDIFLIEARTQKVRQRLPGDSCPVQHLVFSPDGSQLLSAGPDGSALIWDLFRPPPARPVNAEQVDAWWKALADLDADTAYRTMKEMAAHPAEAVKLLRTKLPPIRAVEASRLGTLLTRLDSDEFKEREAASGQLIALGDAVEPRLRAVLRGEPSLELKRRAEDVLRRIDESRLRSERAIEVLGMIDDVSARNLLRELAGGLTGAARTIDATETLARLSRMRRKGAFP